jgi:predicted flap endonuclease-1-like 5' DNA nuclease
MIPYALDYILLALALLLVWALGFIVKNTSKSKKLHALKENHKISENRIKFLETEKENLEAFISDFAKEKSKLIQQSNELKNQIIGKEDSMKDLLIEKEGWDEKFRKLKEYYRGSDKQLSELNMKLSNLNNLHTETQKKLKQAEAEILALRPFKNLNFGELIKERDELKSEILLLKKSQTTPKQDPSAKIKMESQIIKIRESADAPEYFLSRLFKEQEKPDNLKLLPNLDDNMEIKLNTAGVVNFKQLASLSPEELDFLNTLLELPKDKLQIEKWVAKSKAMLKS